MRGVFFLGFVTVIGGAIACSSSQNQSQEESKVKIVGGQAAEANDYPSVIKMTVDPGTGTTPARICTGVIISHRTVLAAAHCIKQKTVTQNVYHFIEIEAGATRSKVATKASYAYTYKEPLGKDSIPDNHVALDLAVMDFGQNAFNLPVYPKISALPPQKGESVTLVGFGATSFSQAETVGTLNFGTNIISEANPSLGYIKVSGQVNAKGIPSGALAAPGDSGGPLFNAAGELVGIGSGLLIDDRKVENYFVDLTSHESKVLVGRYLQEFGGSTTKLIPGFQSALGDEFSTVVPRSPVSNFALIAMCGGRGKGSEGGAGKPSAEGSLGSQFGSGNVGAVPGIGNNANASEAALPAEEGSKSEVGVATESETPEIISSGTLVITPKGT